MFMRETANSVGYFAPGVFCKGISLTSRVFQSSGLIESSGVSSASTPENQGSSMKEGEGTWLSTQISNPQCQAPTAPTTLHTSLPPTSIR